MARRIFALRIELRHIAPDHQPRHIDRLQFRGFACGDELAVAQHRYTVGDCAYLRQAMRDVKDGHALVPKIADDLQQRFRFERCQRRRRLIEDYDAMRHLKCAGDLDQLAPGDGKPRNLRRRIDIGSETLHSFGGLAVHLAVIDHKSAFQLAAHEDVLRDRQVRCQQYLLMHQHQTTMFRVDGSGETYRLPRPSRRCRASASGVRS